MRRNIANTNLTKSYLLSKIDEITIASKYLNIAYEVIVNCIETNDYISSPFRDDSHPSFGFTINNKNKLKGRDFAGYFHGDVFDIVAYVLSIEYNKTIDVSKKDDFYFILRHIAYTFRNIIDNKEIDQNHNKQLLNAIKHIKKQKPIIELVNRSWTKEDKELWSKWNVSLNYLNTHFVYAIEQYYIDRNINPMPKYFNSIKDPCYAYLLGVNKQGVYNIKLYFPKRNKATENKFITNCNCLGGLPNLELDNYDYIIITKSDKDRLALGNHLYNFPLRANEVEQLIGVINCPSENYKLNQQEYDYLNNKLAVHGMLISFMDNDRQGRSAAKYLKDKYNMPYILISRGQFGFANYGAKDFAELCEKYSIDTIRQFVIETFNIFENEKTSSF